MPPFKALVVAFVAAVSMPGSAAAINAEGSFLARGIGAVSCGDMVDLVTGPQREVVSQRLIAWLAGYTTHLNRTHPTAYDAMPLPELEGLATVVARVCANNREARMEAVLQSVLTTLEPLARAEAEQPVQLRSGDTLLTITPSVVRAVQERLIARNLLPAGSADGAFGPMTSQALRTFQEEAGLAASGLPDAWTIFILEAAE